MVVLAVVLVLVLVSLLMDGSMVTLLVVVVWEHLGFMAFSMGAIGYCFWYVLLIVVGICWLFGNILAS